MEHQKDSRMLSHRQGQNEQAEERGLFRLEMPKSDLKTS